MSQFWLGLFGINLVVGWYLLDITVGCPLIERKSCDGAELEGLEWVFLNLVAYTFWFVIFIVLMAVIAFGVLTIWRDTSP